VVGPGFGIVVMVVVVVWGVVDLIVEEVLLEFVGGGDWLGKFPGLLVVVGEPRERFGRAVRPELEQDGCAIVNTVGVLTGPRSLVHLV
jgi:hypothetical protein